MSWLARSIANSLRLDDDDSSSSENDAAATNHNHDPAKRSEEASNKLKEEEGISEEETRGLKEDLTELKQTLTRQLWGVANFLAPFTPEHRSKPDPTRHIPKKNASNYLQFGEEEGNEEGEVETTTAVGITEEVLTFARNIAMHPETWLDFPLDVEEDLDDFDMCDAQLKHVSNIERLAPRLAALRMELSPCHITQSYFWKVYFVLLHSRLKKHDAELLSTSQVMEARAMWMQELHKQTKPEDDWFGTSTSYIKDSADTVPEVFGCVRTFNFDRAIDHDTEKRPITSTSEIQFIDKSVIIEKPIKTEEKELLVGPSSKALPDIEEDDDYWLDEDSDLGSYKATISVGNEEDISFSDLEDDGSSTTFIKSKALPKSTGKPTV